MKNHRSHDIVLMCVCCHQSSNNHDTTLKQRLERECDAPMGTKEGLKFKTDEELRKVKSAAKLVLLCYVTNVYTINC